MGAYLLVGEVTMASKYLQYDVYDGILYQDNDIPQINRCTTRRSVYNLYRNSKNKTIICIPLLSP